MSRWREARVSAEGTHHELDGAPLYTGRFDEALSFHEPGLAAVRRGGEAWHIDEAGEAVYARRFDRTFGFYEGQAAVVDASEWGYIDAAGVPVGEACFAWAGNFQDGRAVVRDRDGRYFHVDPKIRPVYAERWRYAGDYRYGIAVVQGEHGQSTHIDRAGRLLHRRWYADLDVFHKGYARARDSQGWMHVDLQGEPVYGRRFAAVEPFYNGQARAERGDGGVELIDERGETVLEVRPAQIDAFAELSRDLVGFWRTETIAAAVRLGVMEALPARPGAVAEQAGISPTKAIRLLRALGELGLVDEAQGSFRPTTRGVLLRGDHPRSLAGAALEYAGPLRERWRGLEAALRSEDWSPGDVFAEAAGDGERAARHARMLASYARHDYPAIAAALALGDGEAILDAGGGTGVLAEALLTRHPRATITILERPEVAAMIPAREGLTAVAGDLFTPWPVRGDLVILARVLHDWDDALALTILGHARAALRPGGRLAIVEMLRDERGFGGSLCDLHLLAVTGGQERTLAEYTALLGRAGFGAPVHHPIAALPQLLIVRPS